MLATQKTNVGLYLGEMDDIDLFAKRIKSMMRGGEKLSDNDAKSLAQFCSVTHLNPFIGEAWWIPGSGGMVGIAGARRLDQEAAKAQGGYSWPAIIPVSPEEAGASEFEVKDVVASFRVEINNSAATAEYQKMFSATLESMRGAGVADPFSAAKEVCGPRPVWIGYGFTKKTDQSRMSKIQLARKRAEADALKKCIIIPFGAQVADTDVAPAYIDVEARDIQPGRTEADNLRELGVVSTEKPDAPDWTDTPEDWEVEPPLVIEKAASKAMPRTAEISLGSITSDEIKQQEDTPEIRAELRREFSKKWNAAIKKIDTKGLPTINGKSTAKEMREAIAAIDAAVSTSA